MDNEILLFDFDGVIVDSIKLCFSLLKRSLPDLDYFKWQKWSEGVVLEEMKAYVTEPIQKKYFEDYRRGIMAVAPVPGVPEVLKRLAAAYHVLIISSSSSEAIDAYLVKYGLRRYISGIFGFEDGESKAEKIKMIIKANDIQPVKALMVTDTLGDVIEANSAGAKVLAVTWGMHEYKQLLKGTPALIIAKPEEIIGGVSKIFKIS
jgi:phosphoglycolate phosphatase